MNLFAFRVAAASLLSSVALMVTGCGATSADGAGDSVDNGTTTEGEGTEAAALSHSNNQTAFDFFLGKGLTPAQAAGIVGNLDQESGMNPNISQYGGGPGRGIAQWSAGGRWDSDRGDNLVAYAAQKGQSRYSLGLQLDFIWHELESFPGYGLNSLRRASNVVDATIIFERDYEGCGTCVQSNRIGAAEAALRAFGHDRGSSGGGSSGGGHASGGQGCYSHTLSSEMPDHACVQSRYDSAWYQCDNGTWDRRAPSSSCDGRHPL